MTYREKLKNSTVVKTMLLPKSYFGIVTSKKRRNSVIAFLFIAAYTILNKFVFNTIDHFDFMYVVAYIGLSGGLALLWKETVSVTILKDSSNFIDIVIVDDIIGHWRLTDYYSVPQRNRKRNSWKMLRSLARDLELP